MAIGDFNRLVESQSVFRFLIAMRIQLRPNHTEKMGKSYQKRAVGRKSVLPGSYEKRSRDHREMGNVNWRPSIAAYRGVRRVGASIYAFDIQESFHGADSARFLKILNAKVLSGNGEVGILAYVGIDNSDAAYQSESTQSVTIEKMMR